MDIQDIEIFARVAAVQNLSAVGVEMGLTPGTISKRLQALEEELSARLFDRTTRSIRITEEGARFLVHVEAILDELEKARAAVADAVGRPKGKLRVVTGHALARTLVGPAILAFMDEFADIDVHVDLSDQSINLQEAGYDVAIFSGALQDSSLIAKRFAADRFILVAAPAYLARHGGAPRTVAELEAHQLLTLGEAFAWTAREGDNETSVRVHARLKSDNFEFLRSAALSGQGILKSMELHVRDDVAAGRLVPVLGDVDWGSNAGVWALYPPSKHMLPRLRVFLDFLAAWFRTHAGPV